MRPKIARDTARFVTAVACLVLFAVGRPLQAAPNATAIIIVRTPHGLAFGSGAFISSDGIMLTCYHVLQDSTEITVIGSGHLYTDSTITVERIDPDHDLATLKISNPGADFGYFSLSNETPGPADDLLIVGYIAGLANQTLRAETTQAGLVDSEKFLVSGFPIFALPGVKLIPVNSAVYSGMSGSPLIFRNHTIGVISGSLNEGGSIGWAIPVSYVDSLPMPLHRHASEVKWPPLRLMLPRWANLRRNLNVDSDFTEDLSDLLTVASNSVRVGDEIDRSLIPNYLSFIRSLREQLRFVPASEDNLHLTDSPSYMRRQALFRAIYNQFASPYKSVNGDLDSFDDYMDTWNEAIDDLDHKLRMLGASAEQAKLREIDNHISQKISDFNDAVNDSVNEDDPCLAMEDGFYAGDAESVDNAENVQTVGELRGAVTVRCESLVTDLFPRVSRLVKTLPEVATGIQEMLEKGTLERLEAASK